MYFSKENNRFLPNLASALNSLGQTMAALDESSQAEANLLEALDLFTSLCDENPARFLSDFGMVQNNLAVFYRRIGKLQEAKIAYTKTLHIYHSLVDFNPNVYLPDLAMVLNNFGTFCRAVNDIRSAEDSYLESAEIRRELALDNPDVFEPKLMQTLINLAGLYLQNNIKTTEAVTLLKEVVRLALPLHDTLPIAKTCLDSAFDCIAILGINNAKFVEEAMEGGSKQ
jgi:tetratricopeptide (TPR) repeat protein